jgi:hypothetical protein
LIIRDVSSGNELKNTILHFGAIFGYTVNDDAQLTRRDIDIKKCEGQLFKKCNDETFYLKVWTKKNIILCGRTTYHA